jgi:hypothetical protein
MPKLRLKRTPEEEAAHRLRKQEKKQTGRKRGHHYNDTEPGTSTHSGKRRRTEVESERKWSSSDENEEYGPQPASSTGSYGYTSWQHEPVQEEMRAEMEEMRFREKLFDAFADDEKLDALEARMNDFVHIPDRWKTASTSTKKESSIFQDDGWLKVDPQTMDEEEYAEWIRMGMYRYVEASRRLNRILINARQKNARE